MHRNLKPDNKFPISKAYYRLLLKTREGIKFLTPIEIQSEIALINKEFSGNYQCDAQKFLKFFLNEMSSELSHLHPNPDPSQKPYPKTRDEIAILKKEK